MTFMPLESIPWDRVVHFYGRATDIPPAINDLLSDQPNRRKAALQTLTRCLEHQDGVTHATPLAIPFLTRHLASPKTPDRQLIVELLLVFLRSALFQLTHSPPPEGLSLDWLIAPERLWPPFESEEAEEILWEEQPIAEEDLGAWALLAVREIQRAHPAAEQLSIDADPPLASAAAAMLNALRTIPIEFAAGA